MIRRVLHRLRALARPAAAYQLAEHCCQGGQLEPACMACPHAVKPARAGFTHRTANAVPPRARSP